MGRKTLVGSAHNFALGRYPGRTIDLCLITVANFGVDRLRGFNVARGQILGFSISLGFRRRPYYTTTVRVCECSK